MAKIGFGKKILIFLIAIILLYFVLSFREIPAQIDYGVSFSKFHSDELKLDWKEVFGAIVDDLKVKRLRLSAHWFEMQPEPDRYDFSALDYQLKEAKKRDISVVLAVGRRLPGWPECHEPEWAMKGDDNQKRQYILEMVKTVVERYKNYPNIKYWQVENEPFLGFFGKSFCGQPDEEFLKKEIALVKQIDPGRKILVTDSGEFGTWYQAYRNADIFGSSMYLYVWSKWFGPIRYPIGPSFFRVKQSLVNIFYGDKPKILIELSAEPWLLQPIINTPIETQLERMDLDKFKETVNVAAKSGFGEQYLWGAEWWYWLKKNNRPEFWSEAKQIFGN